MKKINKVLAFVMIFLLVGIVNVNAVDERSVTTSELTVTRTFTDESAMFEDNGGSGSRVINAYSLQEGTDLQLYCTAKNNEQINVGDVLSKDKEADYGLSYILQNSYPMSKVFGNDVIKSSCGVTTDPNTSTNTTPVMHIWVVQNAIWGYLDDGYRGKISNLDLTFTYRYNSQECACVDPVLNDTTSLTGAILYDSYVKRLIDGAKAAIDPATSVVNFNFEKGWTVDGDVYKTNLIKPVVSAPDAQYTTISLSLVDAPEGTKVYKKGGEELSGDMSIAAGEEIYITVPSDKAKKAPKFSLKATTPITYVAGYEYVDKSDTTTPAQPVVLLGDGNANVSGALELSIAPDTASSISAAMYFIGLLILLSGAGIIYANVRPRKEEI